MDQSESIEQAVRLYVRSLGLVDPIRFQRWGEQDLTLAQLRLLMLLRARPGATAGALAAELRVTPPTITGLVDRLVRQRLVRREEDPLDRRLVRNELTDVGLAVVGEIERAGRAYLAEIFSRMGEERLQQFVSGLEALIEAADETYPADSVSR